MVRDLIANNIVNKNMFGSYMKKELLFLDTRIRVSNS